jgi:hypothetical protein
MGSLRTSATISVLRVPNPIGFFSRSAERGASTSRGRAGKEGDLGQLLHLYAVARRRRRHRTEMETTSASMSVLS